MVDQLVLKVKEDTTTAQPRYISSPPSANGILDPALVQHPARPKKLEIKLVEMTVLILRVQCRLAVRAVDFGEFR